MRAASSGRRGARTFASARRCALPRFEPSDSSETRSSAFAFVAVTLSSVIALVAVGVTIAAPIASAEGLAASVLPDRLDDLPLSGGDIAASADAFAWRAFIALNWPSKLGAAERGAPDRAKALADPGKRVWETFKADYELFQIDEGGHPIAPAPWSGFEGLNPCGPGVGNREKTIASFAPFADFNQPSFDANEPGAPLVAQNGAYTRYEVHFNETEFSTFATNGWSEGDHLPDVRRPAHFPIGSIAVKAAWRPLTSLDSAAVRARYYVESANVVDVAQTLAAGHVVCAKTDLALVGLHIAIKTKARPQWVWSSFEHVDNVPPAGAEDAREPDAKDAGVPYSYFDPSKPARLWPPFGTDASLPVDWSRPPKLDPSPTQVVRRYPIRPDVMALNRAYWSLPEIKGTIWERYMLVATQWPTSNDPPGPNNNGAFTPGRPASGAQADSYRSIAKSQANLVNTAMETYFQDLPSSCMACHQAASNARGGDFVGALATMLCDQCLRRGRR